MRCIYCGNKLNRNEKFCGSCGYPVDSQVSRITKERKRCIYCGSVLDENETFCGNCGKDIDFGVAFNAAGKTGKQRKNKGPQKWGLIGLAVLLCVLLVGAGVYGYRHIHTDKVSGTSTDTIQAPVYSVEDRPSLVVDDLPEGYTAEDILDNSIEMDGSWVYSPSEANISFDEESCVQYYNNLLQVFLNESLTDEEKVELARQVNGAVVGDISGAVNMLQILVANKNLSALSVLSEQLMQDERVSYANYEVPFEVSESWWTDAAYEDDWGNDSDLGNEENPKGKDWWAEAIGAYTAWEYSNQAQSVAVGIIDTGFDLDHEDYPTEVEMFNLNTEDGHGTHVAGIIAAQHNNTGIRGIADRADVFAVDWRVETIVEGEKDRKFTSDEFILYTSALVQRADSLNENIVINNSLNEKIYDQDHYDKAHFSNYESYISGKTEACCQLSQTYARAIDNMLRNGYENFIIVQSSGNGYNNYGELGLDASIVGDYCGITEEIFPCGTENSYETIKNHIMIVSSVQNETKNGNYLVYKGANYGDTVDICAPGQNIYSTVPNNSYGELSGTSMAAPMVTGAAALVWSMNPSLTAAEVKGILVSTGGHAIGTAEGDKGTIYRMLNVGEAVSCAVRGSISGKLEDSITGEGLSYVSITVSTSTQDNYSSIMSFVGGEFKIYAAGECSITFEMDGYETKTMTVSVGIGEDVDIGTVSLVPVNAAAPVETQNAWESYYQTVLDAYSDRIKNGGWAADVDNDADTLISRYIAYDYAYNDYADDLYYAVVDVGGTGTPELLIAADDICVDAFSLQGRIFENIGGGGSQNEIEVMDTGSLYCIQIPANGGFRYAILCAVDSNGASTQLDSWMRPGMMATSYYHDDVEYPYVTYNEIDDIVASYGNTVEIQWTPMTQGSSVSDASVQTVYAAHAFTKVDTSADNTNVSAAAKMDFRVLFAQPDWSAGDVPDWKGHRLISVSITGTAYPVTYEIGYDGNSVLPSEMSTDEETYYYTYDGQDRLVLEELYMNGSHYIDPTVREYDSSGLVTMEQYTEGNMVQYDYEYDTEGNVVGCVENPGWVLYDIDYIYGNDGQLAEIQETGYSCETDYRDNKFVVTELGDVQSEGTIPFSKTQSSAVTFDGCYRFNYPYIEICDATGYAAAKIWLGGDGSDWSCQYDDNGYLVSVSRSDGTTANFVYEN